MEKGLRELKSHWRRGGNYGSFKRMLPCCRKIAYKNCFVCILEPVSRKRDVQMLSMALPLLVMLPKSVSPLCYSQGSGPVAASKS